MLSSCIRFNTLFIYIADSSLAIFPSAIFKCANTLTGFPSLVVPENAIAVDPSTPSVFKVKLLKLCSFSPTKRIKSPFSTPTSTLSSTCLTLLAIVAVEASIRLPLSLIVFIVMPDKIGFSFGTSGFSTSLGLGLSPSFTFSPFSL